MSFAKVEIAMRVCRVLRQRRYEKLTLTELLRLVQVPRPTFYRYYHDIYQVYEAVFKICYAQIANVPNQTWQEQFYLSLQTLVADRCLFMNLYQLTNSEFGRRNDYVQLIINQWLAHQLIAPSAVTWCDFCSCSLTKQLEDWFEAGLVESAEVIYQRNYPCLVRIMRFSTLSVSDLA